MSYQCAWSARFSHLERYRGFFPSYADNQIDVSSGCTTGETSDRCVDFANGKEKGQATIVNSSVCSIQSKTKQSGQICQERESEGNCGSSSGSGSSASSSGGGRGGGAGGSLGNRVKGRVRKAKTPRRSARRNDPRFRGVTFSVETKLCREKRQKSQLFIRSSYSMRMNPSCKNHLNQTRIKRRNISVSSSTSGSDEPDTTVTVNLGLPQRIAAPNSRVVQGGKQCASCCTKRTPLWRDAEDGTPLCNACGIRYKKYRIRCITCWNIPKKDGKTSCHVCSRCGNMLRITVPKRAGLC